ncbi:RHS repeat-associated core domain-containing protein [Luteimonas sp. A277]
MRLNLFVGLAAVGFFCVVSNSHAQTTVRYFHTDAMGSIVAVSDESGNVVERREYEPYGAQLTPALQDGPGFTGHVQDAATGLTYMQDRYYDPVLGVFLSVDPVTPYSRPTQYFHRYRYAANNPYRYHDPDGREFRSINPANNAKLAGYINARAAGHYRFNETNLLVRTGDNPGGGGSATYDSALQHGIASEKTILLAVQQMVGNVNVDDHGGGLTGTHGNDVAAVISDNVFNTVDAQGNLLTDLPADILAHEIAGHAVQQVLGNHEANAIDIDNQIRTEMREPSLPRDENHRAFDP